jgi:hypothetical protein
MKSKTPLRINTELLNIQNMEYANKVQTNGERWVKEENRWV